MRIRLFAAGAVAGFLLALSGACTQPGPLKCLKSNCSGCCDANGDCQAGTELFACGVGGAACATCGRTDTCNGASCVSSGDAGGGAGGGSGGGTAGGSGGGCGSCNGCCDGAGQCRGGNTFNACGAGGARCVTCPVRQTCVSATCQPFQCSGCWDDAGVCQQGNLPSSCGTDAGACVVCGVGFNCFNGGCVTAPTCGPGNCNGCCSGTSCVSSPDNARCGHSGNACAPCNGADQCVNGVCTAPGGGAGGGSSGGSGGGSAGGFGGGFGGGLPGGCNPVTCLDGCCDSTNTCNTSQSKTACGSLGSTCRTCSFACVGGVCI